MISTPYGKMHFILKAKFCKQDHNNEHLSIAL